MWKVSSRNNTNRVTKPSAKSDLGSTDATVPQKYKYVEQAGLCQELQDGQFVIFLTHGEQIQACLGSNS